MRYEGSIYRPPSEAYSLIVQVTIGCSHNDCTFCSMYKDKKFRVRKLEDVLKDLDWAIKHYRKIDRIFLADGDALMAKTEDLTKILEYIKKNIPSCTRVTSYGSPKSILLKSDEELKQLQKLGLSMIYMGLESGSDKILKNINKGETCKEIIRAGQMIKTADMKLSVTAISGLGGIKHSEEHAKLTGEALSEMKPDYIGLLTLMIDEDTDLRKEYLAGNFKILSPVEILKEMHLMISNMNCEGAVLRANHASNYLPIGGTLNIDKADILNDIEKALQY